jgi:tRNA threonylcarbamoyl adenosine modification protein YeaZ
MPALVLDAAAGAGWLVVLDLVAGDEGAGRVLARRDWPALRDATASLPWLAADALNEAGVTPAALALIAVVAGPGSFTGLRASLAFAHGLALASDAALVPVAVDEAAAAGGERTPASILDAAMRRRAGRLPPLGPVPVYAGPAQARAAPMRPAPV